MLKSNTTPNLVQRVIFFLLLFASVSCETLDPYYKTQENLDLSIEAFNFEFESKAMDISSRFVHPTHRASYMGKSLEMVQRITFFEATILNIKFFKDGAPVAITAKGPGEGFNRAIVVIRYQLAVLPSTKVVTRLVEQEWVLEGEQWLVIPDLDIFLE
ncbi:MAG: hypothetical protein HOA09_04285 [Nitrospina sp.]|nr:hypothetical protein [Nitrospina sp.]